MRFKLGQSRIVSFNVFIIVVINQLVCLVSFFPGGARLNTMHGCPVSLMIICRTWPRHFKCFCFTSSTTWSPVCLPTSSIIINDCIERRNSSFLQFPHCAANCLQHVHSNGQGTVVYKSCARHRTFITCNMSFVVW